MHSIVLSSVRTTRKRLLVLPALLAGAALVCSAQNPPPIPRDEGWKLVWSDEFNGPDGSSGDRSKWVLETGSEGWGNEELEYYTDRTANVLLRNGNLVIRALEEKYPESDPKARNYTSGAAEDVGCALPVRTHTCVSGGCFPNSGTTNPQLRLSYVTQGDPLV